jgi:hypothetical protein
MKNWICTIFKDLTLVAQTSACGNVQGAAVGLASLKAWSVAAVGEVRSLIELQRFSSSFWRKQWDVLSVTGRQPYSV